MQVRARWFVCRAVFIKCICVCLQSSAILTEVRAKLGLEAYETSKSLLWLNYNSRFYLKNGLKKKRKLEINTNQYTLALVFRRFLQGSMTHCRARKKRL